MQVEEDERSSPPSKEVLDKLAVYCGGRAAEELIFGEMTTGAANDIEQATKLARNMVTRFGMSEEFGMMALGTVQNAYLNQDTSLTCAPAPRAASTRRSSSSSPRRMSSAMQMLNENKFKLHELAHYLYKKETITGDEFMSLLTRENPLMPKSPQVANSGYRSRLKSTPPAHVASGVLCDDEWYRKDQMFETTSELRFAVLIDADNVSEKYIKVILDGFPTPGVATYKRIYGDWTSPRLASWKSCLLDHSIIPMQQYSYTYGKNATDSAMIIDAMDILYSGTVDGFAIVSSDSDFTRLVARLRESGMIVIGMGEQKTPKPFISACNQFKYLDLLLCPAAGRGI
ncbi:MAG: NYN domain-containing protein [Collinsella sp.]